MVTGGIRDMSMGFGIVVDSFRNEICNEYSTGNDKLVVAYRITIERLALEMNRLNTYTLNRMLRKEENRRTRVSELMYVAGTI